MSADENEIIFDEVQFREPVRARRPDRDPAWACLAYRTPQPDDLPIFLDRRPADAIERHALRDISVELGGVLLGRECVDDQTGEPFVWVTEHLEAKHYENTQASFTYTHDSWEELTRERDRLHPRLDIVGWYHTHPDFGIFLSGHDLFLHRNFFGQPLQVAYVIDPIRQDRGFFRWRGAGLEQVGGFWLTGDRADRVALARQVNDLESIASAEPLAGGFSPRLEAEIMAMLTRPHAGSATGSPADRALLGVGLLSLGVLVGGLVVAAGGWMASIGREVRGQTAQLAEMQAKLDRTDQVSQAAVATLLARAGSGADPNEFLNELTRTRQALARAVDDAKAKDTLVQATATDYRRVAADLARSQEAATAGNAQAHGLKDELDKERAAVKSLTTARDDWEATEAGVATRQYTNAWYAAVVGWVLASAIATAWGISRLLAEVPQPRSTDPGPGPASPNPPLRDFS